MAEKDILNELTKALSSDIHKKYIQSYISKNEKGLSEVFDELLRMKLSET